MIKLIFLIITILVFAMVSGIWAEPNYSDLNTQGNTATINQSIFSTPLEIVFGTGLADSVVRIQQTGSEKDYNVGARDVNAYAYDEKQGKDAHSLPLTDFNAVNVNGSDYNEFVLDINKTKPDSLKNQDESGNFIKPDGEVATVREANFWSNNTIESLNTYDVSDNLIIDSLIRLD